MVWAMTFLVFTQTILGALMRHEGPGFLSIPDFPKIYGEWMPAFWDSRVLETINQYRGTQLGWPQTTTTLILWQVLHRSIGILAGVGILAGAIWSVRSTTTPSWWSRGMVGWVFLAVTQVLIGISILWTGRLPEVATLHVLFGACLTLTGWLLGFASWRTTLSPTPVVMPNRPLRVRKVRELTR